MLKRHDTSAKPLDWKLWAGIPISALFLYLAFRKVDLDRVWEVILSARLRFVLLVTLATFFQFVIRAWRWALLLRPIKDTGFLNRLAAVLVGCAANFLLPARLGELVRAGTLARAEKLSGGATFGTIVVERLFDGFTLLLILLIGLLGTGFPGEWRSISGHLRTAGYTLFVVYILISVFLFGFKYKTGAFLSLLDRILFFFPPQIRTRFIDMIRNFSLGLVLLKSPAQWGLAIVYSILLWVCGLYQVEFTEMSIGQNLPFIATFIILSMAVFGVMIPSAPGFIGTFHLSVQYGFIFYGIGKEEALSAAVLWHAAMLFPTVLFGLCAFLYLQFSRLRVSEPSAL
ncbi:MAG: lysylphosphatidylglycerol synthase transmembrane domain-containing protein [Desulfatiglandales bacterium]